MLMILAQTVRSESFWAAVKVRSPHTGPGISYIIFRLTATGSTEPGDNLRTRRSSHTHGTRQAAPASRLRSLLVHIGWLARYTAAARPPASCLSAHLHLRALVILSCACASFRASSRLTLKWAVWRRPRASDAAAIHASLLEDDLGDDAEHAPVAVDELRDAKVDALRQDTHH